MHFESEFKTLPIGDIHADAEMRLAEGWRYVQILAVKLEDEGKSDMVYSYMKDGHLMNLTVEAVSQEDVIPSISDLFLEAFVCENEIHDLFGIHIENIAIDFLGNFYQLSTEFPMTIISPEKLAEREKAKKIAAAKAAKAAKAAQGSGDDEEALKEKLKDMDPEKAAKVKAALEAKAAKEKALKAASKEEELEAKLKDMDPEKAAKVRAAMEAKARAAAEKGGE